ncbi:MAG TPA: flagellar protein FlaG, partial [Steroidobacteraceae bacterium]
SSGFTGSRVDVIHAPQPIPAVRPSQRPAPSPAGATAGGFTGDGSPSRPTPAQAAQTLQESVDRLNARLASSNRVVQLRVDAETGITIAEIKNSSTGVVLQEIPGADIVHLAEMLSAWAHGKNILVDLIA